MTGASSLLYFGSAAVCLAWAALVAGVGRRGATILTVAACAATAAWATAVAVAPTAPLEGMAGSLEVARNAIWLALLLTLSKRVGGLHAVALAHRFALAGALGVAVAMAFLLPGVSGALTSPTLGSPALLARIGLALLVIVLAENLWRNADESARWLVKLPCIALGGQCAFDVLLYTAAALSGTFSPALLDARAVLGAVAAPLLAVAAVRDKRWRRDLPISREAVFHGATLVIAGTFLLGVGAAGEALRRLDADWAQSAQASVLTGAALALAVAVSTRSVRSRLRRGFVDHFFTGRYDYRREWLRCVAVLSAPDEEAPAQVRAIRAVADPLDSPAGALLLREPTETGFRWAASWNSNAEPLVLPRSHLLLAAFRNGTWIVDLASDEGPAASDLHAAFGPLWLAVPLQHHRDGLLGAVLLAPPRAPVALDREVYDLLRTLGREVAMFLAERQAAERLADQRKLQDYAKRFAFVAHDVKTVSSQLTLVLANAEENIHDPEFQRDMLITIRASAERINALIARLRNPAEEIEGAVADKGLGMGTVSPAARLRALAAARPGTVQVEEDRRCTLGLAAISQEGFDAAVVHLLNNAAEASAPGEVVLIKMRREGSRVVVDIIDRGPGMAPDFIRDKLFRPLITSKPRGSGIGAWQARELLREAGGDLTVLSTPGTGTTMRLSIPAVPDATRSMESADAVLERQPDRA